MIIGLGGIGSIIIENLVATGIKNYILIDGDDVEVSNLNRQFIYTDKDIDYPKVRKTEEYIKARVRNSTVFSYKRYIKSFDDLCKTRKNKDISIVVNAADYPRNIDSIVGKFCKIERIPFVGCCVRISTGSVGPLLVPNKTICPECFLKLDKIKNSDLEKRIMEAKIQLKGSYDPSNSLIASLLSLIVLSYLSEIPFYNLSTYNIVNFKNLSIEKEMCGNINLCKCWSD